ncbi:MAG: radical SAM protein [Spirochaetaceae bacterium]
MEQYNGIEIGPIRPPSEANSLMVRVTRNCPWNKCKFCGLYNDTKFSIRSEEDVIKDINKIKQIVDSLLLGEKPNVDSGILSMVNRWLQTGMESVFLQDANTLVIKPDTLVRVLEHIRVIFPKVKRVTSYARAQSVSKISDTDMKRLKIAGLNRIHIGMESGSPKVLEFINKGVDKETQIIAGIKVKQAGIELSEYFMPGLGGKELSKENALETADIINQINPDFIRIRTLGIPGDVELSLDVSNGKFIPLGDIDKVKEIHLFLTNLKGITSSVKSDHILNLLQESEGQFPQERQNIINPIEDFLNLSSVERMYFMVGRRIGIFNNLNDLKDNYKLELVKKSIGDYNITISNVETFTEEIIKQFI